MGARVFVFCPAIHAHILRLSGVSILSKTLYRLPVSAVAEGDESPARGPSGVALRPARARRAGCFHAPLRL